MLEDLRSLFERAAAGGKTFWLKGGKFLFIAGKFIYDTFCCCGGGGPTPCTCDDGTTPHCTDGSVPTVVGTDCICDDGTIPLCGDGNPPSGVPPSEGGQCPYCTTGTGRSIVAIQLPADWVAVGGDIGCSFCQTTLSNRKVHTYKPFGATCIWQNVVTIGLVCMGTPLSIPWVFEVNITDDGTDIIIQVLMGEDFVGFQTMIWQLNTGVPIATKINCNWVNLSIPFFGYTAGFSNVCAPLAPEEPVLITAL